MDAADDAELEHWIQGQDMDITRKGVVTDKDVVLAHALLRDHVGKRFGHLQRAFRLFDEDKSGKLSRREMLRVLMIFNMHTTPARVFDRLMEFCEPDADGVDYAAFAKLLTTDTQDVIAKLGVTRDGQNALTMALDPDSSHDAELQFWIDRHTNVLPVHHPGPVTREEIAQAHRMIRLKFEDRFVHLERAFRMIDDDKSGQLGQKEMLRVLMMFNLHKINAKVLDELIKMADNDKDGRINYAEFCAMVTTPTAQLMARAKK
uniref:EF-hand domain-containing protein n=1 Tax=Prymnesium polylepis TaxID=72548 RepID=A0A7S4IW82_9EUKA